MDVFHVYKPQCSVQEKSLHEGSPVCLYVTHQTKANSFVNSFWLWQKKTYYREKKTHLRLVLWHSKSHLLSSENRSTENLLLGIEWRCSPSSKNKGNRMRETTYHPPKFRTLLKGDTIILIFCLKDCYADLMIVKAQ